MHFPPNLRGIGLPWFTEAEWLDAKARMEDGHTFHDTYAAFVERFEKVEHRLRGQGQATIRVHIRMDEFIAWCRASGRKVDAQGRSEYAAIKAAEGDRGRG